MLSDVSPTPPAASTEDRINPARAAHPVATRCAEGSYGMVYIPQAGQSLQVDARSLQWPLRAWWYDPRDGRSHLVGEHPSQTLSFTSPIAGPDWVLVFDSIEQDYPMPGVR
jgi:hypothetical protein